MSYYRVQHLLFSIDDPRGLMTQTTERLLGRFACSAIPRRSVSQMAVSTRLASEAPNLATSLKKVWTGNVDDIFYSVYRDGDRRVVTLPQRGWVDYDTSRGVAEINLLDCDDKSAKVFMLMQVVADSLCIDGHCFVHAACLAVPRDAQWSGVLICAPSYTGKTTTALTLANSGWRLVTDDITYVQPAHLGSHIWGFPRACHIRPGTLKLLPWLHDLQLERPNSEGVRSLPVDSLAERGWAEAPWLKPNLLVMLAPHNTASTRVTPIDQVAALSRLAAESVNAVPGVCDQSAPTELATLARLVSTTPSCLLSVGPDLENVAMKLEAFLDDCLSRSTGSPHELTAA